MVINNYKGAAQYMVNQAASGHWLQVRLRGRQSNRDGVGAIVRVRIGELRQMRVVTAGESYASQFSRVVHFGLGNTDVVERLEILWPSGVRQEWSQLAADRLIEIDEGSPEVREVRGPRSVARLERLVPQGTVCVTPPPAPPGEKP